LTDIASRHRVSANPTALAASHILSRRLSDSLAEVTTGSGSTITSTSTATKTIQKMRIRLLPFLFLLYVVAYIDRINIGFAALTMNKDLGITSRQFGLVAGIFFFGYCFFEIPSNLLLHKIGARIWIARILLTWGIVAILTGLVHTAHQNRWGTILGSSRFS
jgi:sugar phosphate permease